MTSPVLSRSIILTAAGLALSSSVHAQSDIDPTNKYSWEENCGWMNWRDANNALQGVRDRGTYLSGMAWGENVGWVNFGGGALASPAQPARFDSIANRFRGYAWAENIGWINLDDANSGKFVARLCYANCDQSTNAPILNVNDFSCFLNKYAAGDAFANCDRSTIAPILNVNDFSCFLNKFAAGCP